MTNSILGMVLKKIGQVKFDQLFRPNLTSGYFLVVHDAFFCFMSDIIRKLYLGSGKHLGCPGYWAVPASQFDA
jgi:hypothetical protein